jgi:hypothetical protein
VGCVRGRPHTKEYFVAPAPGPHRGCGRHRYAGRTFEHAGESIAAQWMAIRDWLSSFW